MICYTAIENHYITPLVLGWEGGRRGKWLPLKFVSLIWVVHNHGSFIWTIPAKWWRHFCPLSVGCPGFLFNTSWHHISSLHVAGVQKLVLQRGPMAWSWRKVGQGGSERSSISFAPTEHIPPYISYSLLLPGFYYKAVSILGATSKTPNTPAIFLGTTDLWETPSNFPQQGRGCYSNSLCLFCQLSGSSTSRQDMITSFRFSWGYGML